MRTLTVLVMFAASACTGLNTAQEVAGTPVGTGGESALASGLPCDIDSLLGSYCRGCHGAVPSGGAPMSLETYADLMAPAKSDPSKRVADVCLTRMQSTTAPMPPSAPGPTTAEIQTFAAWLSSGTPMGSCAASGSDPLNAAPTCTSMSYWTGGNQESASMHPGGACISCHTASSDGPRFAIAGTVFPTGHEPTDCNAANIAGAQVVITDANGATLTLTPIANGNFSWRSPIALPYHAKVVFNGNTRAMSAAQTSGDCNSCHTQTGANGAPGRITLP